MYLRALLASLTQSCRITYDNLAPTRLFGDNQGSLCLALSGFTFSDRSKHIAIRSFFVSEMVADGKLTPYYLPTEYQVADLFTKALDEKSFTFLSRSVMGKQSLRLAISKGWKYGGKRGQAELAITGNSG